MKAGTYKLIALEDKNSDYKFNQGREKIGFVNGFVELPTEEFMKSIYLILTKILKP